jgi:hypothetical protein
VAVAQLVVVAVAPSKGHEVADPTAASAVVAAPGTGAGPVLGQPQAAAGPSSATGGAALPQPAGAASSAPTGAVRGTGPGAAAEDRSRCSGAVQFKDFLQSPPCVPHTGNPGATYAGVTGKTIKLVYFREKDNPVVRGLLESQGLYSDPEDQRRYMAAMEKFINLRYELYGRKVVISFWQSPCEAAPPVDSCFRDDAKALVAKEHPFGVVYDNNTNTPAFFDELSKQRVLNFGGWHFADAFNVAHRPYHWDALMGGDTQAELTGAYW